jgi:hypothetical protein
VSQLPNAICAQDDQIHGRILPGHGVCRLSDALEIGEENFARVVALTEHGEGCDLAPVPRIP